MTDELLALARALVAHPKWAWREGMRVVMYTDSPWRAGFPQPTFVYGRVLAYRRDHSPHLYVWWEDAVPHGRYTSVLDHPDWDDPDHGEEHLPDLHDAATAGVLLGMLPANRVQGVRPLIDDIGGAFGWRVVCRRPMQAATPRSGFDYFIGDTLGEACAQALLAVWGE